MSQASTLELYGNNKADKLVERFGKQGFDYIGDHMRDFPVWQASNLAILVNVSTKVIRKTQHYKALSHE
jgi:3-deoxy-D-manno-octulosonate 8-phosphate phosphatase KdsC-like HAD superfamily phosphatase